MPFVVGVFPFPALLPTKLALKHLSIDEFDNTGGMILRCLNPLFCMIIVMFGTLPWGLDSFFF